MNGATLIYIWLATIFSCIGYGYPDGCPVLGTNTTIEATTSDLMGTAIRIASSVPTTTDAVAKSTTYKSVSILFGRAADG